MPNIQEAKMRDEDVDNATTATTSPIEQPDDVSAYELSITQLSLPDSFDQSLCLDLLVPCSTRSRSPDECHRAEEVHSAVANNADVIESLKSQISHQSSLYDAVSNREKELQHQILQYKRKILSSQRDLNHAKNEAAASLQRAIKAEKECEANASSLRSVRQQYEVAIHSEATTLQHAVEQAKILQHDLNELRYEKEAKEADYLDINRELERQLSEVRSDLKVKSGELNTIRIRHDQGVAEWQRLKQDHAETKTALAQLQTEYAKSEQIIQQKTELLEMYQHEDLLIDDDEDGDATNDAGGQTLGRRKLLLRNSIALASKCRKLESSLEQTQNQLHLERDKNQLLTKKNLANQNLFQELASQTKKTTSSCMFSALKARDKEVFDLTSSVNLLQEELYKLQSERDDLSTKLSDILSRRNEVKDMRALVESMRGSIIAPDTCGHCIARQSECINEDNDDDDDDLLDHIVHCFSALQS